MVMCFLYYLQCNYSVDTDFDYRTRMTRISQVSTDFFFESKKNSYRDSLCV